MVKCNYDITSNEYADYIISNNIVLSSVEEAKDIVCTDYADPLYSIIYVPRPPLRDDVVYFPYAYIPNLYTLIDSTSMAASGITPILDQPYLNLGGQGTMIGFIDTGIDYRNMLFRNTDGTTRVMGIWDQTIQERADLRNNPLSLANYGTEFTQRQINTALQSDNPLEVVPSMDEIGHGTFAAGIAAGNESSGRALTGAAPKCSIGVVKLKPAKQYLRDFYCIQDSAIAYQENDIMMGIRYLMQLASQYRMPLVIYIGLGTNYGSHEGTSSLCIMLRRVNNLIGTTTVVAAGNESGLRSHFHGHFVQNQPFEDVEIQVGQGEKGFITQLWATAPESYAIGFISPLGRVIERIPINFRTTTSINFILEDTQLAVYYGISEFGSGSSYIYMRFKNPTPGIWRIRVYNRMFITGDYHMWLPVQGFIKRDTYFINSDPDTIITEPGNTNDTITVGAYNHHNDSIYMRSSRGFNRINIVKPDLVAPGVEVMGPGLAQEYPGRAQSVISESGTSVAAAHVAGAAAILLNWGIVNQNRLNMTTATIKAILIRGADRNPAYEFPNKEWGYGTLNLYQSFLRLSD